MKIDKKAVLKNLYDFGMILLGSTIMAFSYSLFLIPHHLVPGGISGIAIIINYFAKLPVGILIIILNIPIFLIGIKVMGRKYGVKSFFGMIASSLITDFLYEVVKIKPATDNVILASIYSGILIGLGLGIIFRRKASTGGSDTLGQVINKYSGLSVGLGILIVDFVIISASGFAYKSLEAPLYGYIVLFISTRVIDMILEGWNYTKLAIIISKKNDIIGQFIINELNRGGTSLLSRSLYLKREGETILSVIHRKQVSHLRDFVKEVDPDAFMILNDTYAVLGKGFKSMMVS
jgi:uncharacterized membrane-anchored protein YitT (DUF2179 family)